MYRMYFFFFNIKKSNTKLEHPNGLALNKNIIIYEIYYFS